MNYISTFVNSSYVDPVELCCGWNFFPAKNSPRCSLGGGGPLADTKKLASTYAD
jgi:hypothetical protein